MKIGAVFVDFVDFCPQQIHCANITFEAKV
jgi:hypothetical protein